MATVAAGNGATDLVDPDGDDNPDGGQLIPGDNPGAVLIQDPADSVLLSSAGFVPVEDRPVIRVSLPDAEVGQLEDVLGISPDVELRQRVQIILTAYLGHGHSDVATDTGTSHRSVQRWLSV